MGLAIGIILGGLTLVWLGWNLTLDALWQPTDRKTVRRILHLASVKPGERLIDLGCGDGRIVIAAAREFGADAVGVEIDPFRVLWARACVLLAGLSGRVRIVRGNMYAFDLSGADVVVLFLSATSNFRLQDRLRRELKPDARVVSYYHPIWGWRPEAVGEGRDGYPIYLYRIGGEDEKAAQ